MKRFLKIIVIAVNIPLMVLTGMYGLAFITGPVDQLFGLIPLLITIVSLVIVISFWKTPAMEISYQRYLLGFLPPILLILITFSVLDFARDAIQNGNK